LLFKFAAKIRDGERRDKEKSAEAGKTNAETGIVVDRIFIASHLINGTIIHPIKICRGVFHYYSKGKSSFFF
jgi:hypothetical protein